MARFRPPFNQKADHGCLSLINRYHGPNQLNFLRKDPPPRAFEEPIWTTVDPAREDVRKQSIRRHNFLEIDIHTLGALWTPVPTAQDLQAHLQPG